MGINVRRKYGYDKELAKAGVKMIIGPEKETDWLLVRRIPNKDYLNKLTENMQANGDKIRELADTDPEASEALDTQLHCDLIGETVIIDWGEGIKDDDGPIPYSPQAASELLFECEDLKSEVIMFARDRKNYPMQFDAEKAKKN